ncbi:MAG: RnfH family protein [Methylococcaceae bacterium]
MIEIEVAYATPQKQTILAVDVAESTTVKEAIDQSDILQRFPEINLAQQKVGIFSSICSLEKVVEANDRVEIYRPLLIDPKEARRNRAEQQAASK